MAFDFKELCLNCGTMVDTWSKVNVTCPCCGETWHSSIDYSHGFAKSDTDLYKNLETNGGLSSLFIKKLDDGDINVDGIADDVFSIISSADGLSSLGLPPDIGLKSLCQQVNKWKSIPNQKYIHIHSFLDDTTIINPFDTLGVFGIADYNKKKTIILDPIDIIKNHSVSVAILTILHELMHAAMYIENGPIGDYWYYKEEAYANAFALKLLKGSKWYDSAFAFVQKQPTGYNAAALLVEQPLSMDEWRKEKQKREDIGEEGRQNWLNRYVNY